MNQSLWEHFSGASLLVQLIMLVLLSFSVASWAVIFYNARQFAVIRKKITQFKGHFWSASELTDVYGDYRQTEEIGISSVFVAGFKEFLRISTMQQERSKDSNQWSTQVSRAMTVVQIGDMDRLERRIHSLSIIGSTSPYIGLLGTVWGIMHTLQSLSEVHQPSLAVVAPGISEALVATALGLFVAIPAVIAYNWFCSHLTETEREYEMFRKELINLLELQNKS